MSSNSTPYWVLLYEPSNSTASRPNFLDMSWDDHDNAVSEAIWEILPEAFIADKPTTQRLLAQQGIAEVVELLCRENDFDTLTVQMSQQQAVMLKSAWNSSDYDLRGLVLMDAVAWDEATCRAITMRASNRFL